MHSYNNQLVCFHLLLFFRYLNHDAFKTGTIYSYSGRSKVLCSAIIRETLLQRRMITSNYFLLCSIFKLFIFKTMQIEDVGNSLQCAKHIEPKLTKPFPMNNFQTMMIDNLSNHFDRFVRVHGSSYQFLVWILGLIFLKK